MASLHRHIKEHARKPGFPRPEITSKPKVWQILKEQEIKPFKIKYYCKKRVPDFETKMHDILMVYKQVGELSEGKKRKIQKNKVLFHKNRQF